MEDLHEQVARHEEQIKTVVARVDAHGEILGALDKAISGLREEAVKHQLSIKDDFMSVNDKLNKIEVDAYRAIPQEYQKQVDEERKRYRVFWGVVASVSGFISAAALIGTFLLQYFHH